MKKIIAIFLSLIFVLSLTACGGTNESQSTDSASSTDAGSSVNSTNSASNTGSSEASSDSEEESTGFPIAYSSVAPGYLEHVSIWNANVINFDSFECMVDEYLFLPAGTTIICDKRFAVYCYMPKGEYLVFDEESSAELGQSLAGLDISLRSGTYVLNKDAIVRFVVNGTLSDVRVYVPKELESQVKLGVVADFAE